MDSTGGTNKYGYSMCQFVIVDALGFGIPVAYWLSPFETVDSFTRALQGIKNAVGDAWKPTCFFTDKDLNQREAIKRVFPGAVVRLCEWHTHGAFLSDISSASSTNID